MKIVILILTMLFFLFACKKEKPFHATLPAITTSGENTMGFFYDGSHIWTNMARVVDPLFGVQGYSRKGWCVVKGPDSPFIFAVGGSTLITNEDGDASEASSLNLDLGHAIYASKLYTFDSAEHSFATFTDNISGRNYYSSERSFTVMVSYIDTVQKPSVIAGTFSGILYYRYLNSNLLDSITITDGRFDVAFY